MDWFKKLPPSERAEHALEQILTRTGIGAEISKEIEGERAVRFEALRKQKAAAIAQFLQRKAVAEKKAEETAANELAARRAAEAALQEHIRAQNAVRDIYGELRTVTDQLDPQMIACCDRAIDDFAVELQKLLEECASLITVRVDGKGKVAFDNRPQVDRRANAILQLQSVILPNLKIAADILDVVAELERLRATIPEVSK